MQDQHKIGESRGGTMIVLKHTKRMAGGKASQIRTLAFLAEDPV